MSRRSRFFSIFLQIASTFGCRSSKAIVPMFVQSFSRENVYGAPAPIVGFGDVSTVSRGCSSVLGCTGGGFDRCQRSQT